MPHYLPKAFTFRRVSSHEELRRVIELLSEDVRQNGGSATEIVNLHGDSLMQITICQVPLGIIVVKKEVSRLEALAWWWAPVE